MWAIRRTPASSAASRAASSAAATLSPQASLPRRTLIPTTTSRFSRAMAAASRGRAYRMSWSSPTTVVTRPAAATWTNASTRTGAVSMVCRRNDPKFEKPAVPASTAVVTPPRRLATGSRPYGLPSYQWPCRSTRPGSDEQARDVDAALAGRGQPRPAGAAIAAIRPSSTTTSKAPSRPAPGSRTRPPWRIVRVTPHSCPGPPARRSSRAGHTGRDRTHHREAA